MSVEKGSFMKQAMVLAAAGLFVRFLGFLYRIPLTDMIGDQGNGIYGISYTIYNLLFILSSAGLPAVISKMVSERNTRGEYANAHKVFQVAMRVAMIGGGIAACVMWFGAEYIAQWLNSPRSYYAILTLVPTVFIVAVVSVFRGYFQGMQNTVPTAFSQVIEQLVNGVFTVLLAHIFVKQSLEMGVAGATAGTGIGTFAALLVMMGIYSMAKPRIRRKIKRDKTKRMQPASAIAKELLKTAIPIVAGTAIFSITSFIDTKMVTELLVISGWTVEEAETLYGLLSGKYVLLTTLPVAIATAMATALVPNIAASYVMKDLEAVRYKVSSSIRIAMMISIPAAVGLAILGDQILLMLFPTYPAGGMLLKVGAASVILLAATQIATGMLQGINLVRVPVFAAFCGALVKLPLNYILIQIPQINVLGAVLSTTACYFVAGFINIFVLSRKLKMSLDFVGGFCKPLLASGFMALAAYTSYHMVYIFVASNTGALIFAICMAILMYFIALLLMKGLSEDDIRLFPFSGKLLRVLKGYRLM